MGPLDQLIRILAATHRVLVLTGAGISTASGIPDFRGPQGIWKKRQPVYFQEFLASEDKRVEYWDYKAEGWEAFRAAKPNTVHLALARLEKLGRVGAIVTQNIDGLHQEAGSSAEKVVEVHGTNRSLECVDCGKRSDPDTAVAWFRKERRTPACECGGWLKFATISFGQALRPEVVSRAVREAQEADAALSLGSTLSVQPAAGIPLLVARRGLPYAVVNRGETDHDRVATLRIEGDVGDFVPAAVQALEREAEARA
ncbi:MAG: Sir2 family NAD-dependent protein deacetylase [Candidatus Wallbacteria bacterium]|nr:Sir2 family NAD-dependent protein deacetylase [Candidatus Wallbacteria bacterium]